MARLTLQKGHTANLYEGDKLLIFGGENEHRTYLSDLIIFDLETAHWTQPAQNGPIPRGRARHASVLYDDKLFVMGGISGQNNCVLDDICYLDLKTFTWSRTWRFVARYDHQAFTWADRLWVFGGMSDDAVKVADAVWLDLKGTPAFDSTNAYNRMSRISQRSGSARQSDNLSPAAVGASGYAANTSSAQVTPPSFHLTSPPPMVPGSISSTKFLSGPNIPNQTCGIHFHAYSSGVLLDFATPSSTTSLNDCSLSSLDLDSLRWSKLADGREVFRPGFRWHYCTVNENGTKAWLLGTPISRTVEDVDDGTEFLSDVMELDLGRYGLLGNDLAASSRPEAPRSRIHSGRNTPQPSKGLGADLARLFNIPPDGDSGTDFVVTALKDDENFEEDGFMSPNAQQSTPHLLRDWSAPDATTSPPIYVHKLILQARWPHFARLYNSQMAEFHSKKMHMPEPYSVVKAFLYYLYTDSVSIGDVPDLNDVAGLLVLSNMYDIPPLRLLCVNRLSKEMDVEHACIIWRSANTANEDWLRKRAAHFCLVHWGRVVRTHGFLKLPRSALVELSQETDMEARVVGGEELEAVGGLSGGKFGVGGVRKASVSSSVAQQMNNDSDMEDDEDENMDVS